MTRPMAFLAGATCLLSLACGSTVGPREDTGGAGGQNTTNTTSSGGGPDGTGGNSTSNGGGPAVDQAALCRARADANCDRFAACADFLIEVSYGDLATCKARGAAFCDEVVSAPGFTAVEEDAVASCVADLASMSCHEFWGDRSEACAPVPGALPDGSACAFDEQCASTFCKGAFGNACGACAARTPAGGNCSFDSSCAWGTTCVSAGSAAPKCVALGLAGDRCENSGSCAYSLGCIDGVCTEMAPGDACESYDQCGQLAGLYCESGACAPIEVGETGGACGTGDLEYCSASGACENGICAAPAPDGGACADDGGFGGCQLPAECLGGVCVFPSASLCN